MNQQPTNPTQPQQPTPSALPQQAVQQPTEARPQYSQPNPHQYRYSAAGTQLVKRWFPAEEDPLYGEWLAYLHVYSLRPVNGLPTLMRFYKKAKVMGYKYKYIKLHLILFLVCFIAIAVSMVIVVIAVLVMSVYNSAYNAAI